MIMFIGLPKTGSSWLYTNLKKEFFVNSQLKKEPHFFNNHYYFNKENVTLPLDFTTHNWAADSGLIKQFDQYITHYVYVARKPTDLARSWHQWIDNNQSFEHTQTHIEFYRLCDIGSVLERWYNLVDRKKIIVDTYENLKENNFMFYKNICQQLNLTTNGLIFSEPVNVSPNLKSNLDYTDSFLHRCDNEIKKFKSLTGIKIYD